MLVSLNLVDYEMYQRFVVDDEEDIDSIFHSYEVKLRVIDNILCHVVKKYSAQIST